METSECFLGLIKKLQGDMPPKDTLSPESTDTLYALAHGFYENGKYEDASDVFRYLTTVDASCRKYWMGMAASLQMQKEYEEAIQVYGVAALLDEKEPYAHFHAAECFFQLGNVKQALLALKSAEITSNENVKHQALLPNLALVRERWSQDAVNSLTKEG